MDITEDYVSFKVAKLLKENGFDEKCHSAWLYNPRKDNSEYFVEYLAKGTENNTELGYFNEPDTDWAYSAPTLQKAMKWLRKAHKCIITCYWEFENYVDGKPDFSSNIVWSYNIAIAKYNSARKGNGDYFDMYSVKEDYPTYEEACDAAIMYFLTNLI